MNVYKLSETFAVAGQIRPEDVPAIADAGYQVLINNRPDGEEAGQPSSADIAAAAAAAGLEYHHLPTNALDFPGPGADTMADLLAEADRPVFAFCRTGTRCTNLWIVTRGEDERDAAVAHARAFGFDLSLAARAL
jgi:uncharacterized protein (TIGR01244 family)